ncbi:MAG: riboflavin synthase [Chthoniobacteraceae bacterium]
MFTGLVIETGEIVSLSRTGESARLTLRAPATGPSAKIGDSIAVNGCCLTVTVRDGERVSFDLLAETLRLTNLGALSTGTKVNLEPALGAGAKLGGHFVQGHVDTAAKVLDFSPHGADFRLEVALPADFAQYVAFKGSIAVDGISLTVAEVKDASFVCWIIPHTREVTNLAARKKGERVNLEFDLLAKYVERIVARKRE